MKGVIGTYRIVAILFYPEVHNFLFVLPKPILVHQVRSFTAVYSLYFRDFLTGEVFVV